MTKVQRFSFGLKTKMIGTTPPANSTHKNINGIRLRKILLILVTPTGNPSLKIFKMASVASFLAFLPETLKLNRVPQRPGFSNRNLILADFRPHYI